MNDCVSKFGWDRCELRGGRFRDTVVATNPEKRQTYRGITTLYGRFFKVGGLKQQTAMLEMENGQKIKATLTDKEMAIELASMLHRVVGLEGEATWYSDTDQLKCFEAHSISPYLDRNIDGSLKALSDAFKALRNVSGDRWDSVDPEQYMHDLRSDVEGDV
jgi:hypothetical protein